MAAAPQFNTRRRNARVGPLRLPRQGRKGRVPRWPLGGAPPTVWRDLWRTPQAVAWEDLGWTRVVARYAVVLLAAERLEAGPLAEARQLEDRLGLTPKAMRLLLWTIDDDVEEAVVVAVMPDRWRNAAAAS